MHKYSISDILFIIDSIIETEDIEQNQPEIDELLFCADKEFFINIKEFFIESSRNNLDALDSLAGI